MNRFPLNFLLFLAVPLDSAADIHEPRFKIDPDLPPAEWVLRPARVKTPEQSIATFDLPPGFRAEAVASEPVVRDPIALTFAPDGRIWVIEYPGYNWEYRAKLGLPDEPAPAGRVVVIEDTNGDGLMDKRTVFLDDIDNPRAVALVGDGVLVGQPPELWFYRDTNNDGRADDRQRLYTDYGPLATSHSQPSGLTRALDNWIYSTRFTSRIKYHNGQWLRDGPIVSRGQWGISQDNFGRLFYNTQADPLRADLVPPIYWRRNTNLQNPAGLNVRIANDLRDVKAHAATPGVNQRTEGFLDPMGRLVHFTSSGSPAVYRGRHFPENIVGDIFIAVPAGNFVRHYRATNNDDGGLEVENAYEDHEFLFAHDERFRPVQTVSGPDGALYIVDMYRGIIEGQTWITDITHNYIVKRKLHEPFNGLGRIYRIVHEGRPLGDPANLAGATPLQLVGHLSHPNGWWRDTAQRLLVETAPGDEVLLALHALAIDRSKQPYVRLHALRTLEGLDALTAEGAIQAMGDSDYHVRAAALQLAEPWIDDHRVLSAIVKLADDPHIEVRRQLLYTLGGSKHADAENAMRRVILNDGGERWMNDAALSGLQDRELHFLETLIADPAWQNHTDSAEHLVRILATAIMNQGKAENLTRLARLINSENGWWRVPALTGLGEGETANFAGSPEALRILLEIADDELRKRATTLVSAIKAKPVKAAIDPGKLEESVRRLYERGRTSYLICAACHQTEGQGYPGVAPPLAGSPWLDANPDSMIRIALNGYSHREDFPPMAPLPGLDDELLASILTYLRFTFAENGTPVKPENVKRIRAETSHLTIPWTLETLEAAQAPLQ